MAQAEEKYASIDSQILIELQAPEVLKPQVLDKEPAMEKAESQPINKKRNKLSKIFNKSKKIKDVKASVDAKVMAYRNYQFNF